MVPPILVKSVYWGLGHMGLDPHKSPERGVLTRLLFFENTISREWGLLEPQLLKNRSYLMKMEIFDVGESWESQELINL